jgi:hypothetical protein
MNELFTVNYALFYEGWKYAKNIAPYNVYQLDQFIIRVRRNDFYLVLFIYNGCQELAFISNISISGLTLVKSGTEIRISGTPDTLEIYNQTVLVQGNITGVILSIAINVTVYELNPESYILLEDGNKILLEDNVNFLIIE